jgi:hypothetical protein
MLAESLVVTVLSIRRVIGEALETLLSSEILVVTMEFNGDDLTEEDSLSSVFVNKA